MKDLRVARAPRRPSGEAMPAARTRTESLRLKLEEEILTRTLPPGSKLDEEGIAARFGLSRTPVREALNALTSSGLVEIRPHQGAFVAVLTPRVIIEMVEMMTVLEVSCAEMAARRHSARDRENLLKAQKMCEDPRSLKDPVGFYAANIRFHEAVYHASGNEFLAAQTQALRQRLEPYRRQIAYHPGLIEKANREHGLIVEAILSMNETAAGQAMRSHLGALKDTIATLIEA